MRNYPRHVPRWKRFETLQNGMTVMETAFAASWSRKKKYPGIIGVVADIIDVDKKYEIAVETALGGSIQNIVTEDDTTAKQIISFLKQNKYGRATFLPLNTITDRGQVKKRNFVRTGCDWNCSIPRNSGRQI